MKTFFKVFPFYFLLLFSLNSNAASMQQQVTNLLALAEPEGVVFDIETLEADALSRLMPDVVKQIQRIKSKYPEMDIAVVTHGAEEFALQASAQAENAELHQQLDQLVAESGISVHVCGAVAGLKKVSQEDFPEFVSYSESGLAQLNDYKALDYSVITVNSLNDKQRKQLFESPFEFIK